MPSSAPSLVPSATLLALLALGASGARADPPKATKTFVCSSQGAFVSTFQCPALDPKVGKLVSIDAVLEGRVEVEIQATAPSVGPKTFSVEVDHTIDLYGFSFYWPGSGSTTATVGPLMSSATVVATGSAKRTYTDASTLGRFNGTKVVQMVASADLKTVAVPGATLGGVGMKGSARFTLTYNYVPEPSLVEKAAAMGPVRPIRSERLPPLKDMKPIPHKPASGVGAAGG